MTTTPETPCHDWSRFDAMTDAERHAAALKDPDAQPLTPERMAAMKRTPRVRLIRRTGDTTLQTAARLRAKHGVSLNEAAKSALPKAAFDEMWDEP